MFLDAFNMPESNGSCGVWAQNIACQVNNGILVKAWHGYPRDEEMLQLIPLLEKLHSAEDVRPVIANSSELHRLEACTIT